MKCAQAAEETRVADEAVPALADEGGAGERGRQRREADEDQGEEILVVKRRRQDRRGGHGVAVLACVEWTCGLALSLGLDSTVAFGKWEIGARAP